MTTDHRKHVMAKQHYQHLFIMAGLSFLAMYILMYAMVSSIDDVYMNVNQVYMAGLMTAPMIVIELMVMRAMYQNRKLNAAIIGSTVVVGAACFLCIQQQTFVGNRQFLRSMIPHHSAAILMCRQASIEDPEIKGLCEGIVSGQQTEIDQMRGMLRAPE